ncbi:hypothetical protein JTE90_003576 [Oedothorax gibbosus]|uniref:Dynamin-binding protein n=1 Tax=Oedothorax gibbosus TaxID=931172 RepID=A0AAV6VLG1_9ARAC|nr:hypothetical protein JTE90_003576 [Oedothorax gibbosus]
MVLSPGNICKIPKIKRDSMDTKPGRLVRAIYDFPTDEPSELPLQTGDVIQVKERLDKQWSHGLCNNREGSFPIGFTVELKIPQLGDQEELFAVANDFCAQEEGDLSLKKGDLVVGKLPIDSNWWKGEIEGQVGIFPVTHVWKVDKHSLPVTTNSKKMSLTARVKLNLKAQIDEEMDLYKDEIVTIIEEVEKGWYRGECNGRQGIFPATFVTLVTGEQPIQNPPPAFEVVCNAEPQNTTESDNHNGYDCVNSGIMPYGKTIYPFKAEYANELGFNSGEIVNLIRHVDNNWLEGELDGKVGIFPANFVNIVVDCPNSKESSAEGKENNNDIDMNVFPEDTYGRVIFDFYPQLEGDVRLKEGDTVTLIRKIDQKWLEVMTDNGETGICPENYIEFIGSGPPSYNEVMQAGYDFPINQTFLTNSNYLGQKKGNYEDSTSSISTNLNTFSSHNDNEATFNTRNSTANFDDSAVGSLDFSLNNSTSNRSSSLLIDTFEDSGINNSRKEADLSSSFSSNVDFYQNVPNQNLSASSNCTSGWSSENSINKDQQLTTVSKMPVRPPPPTNVSNNSRISTISVSSNSSSEALSERSNEEEIRCQISQKEQTLKIRIACKNKLENECGQNYNNFASNEISVQITHLNEEINQLQQEITDLNSQLSDNKVPKESVIDTQARDEEAARKKEIENKRRELERIKKRKEQRDCIITELLQTEKDYLSDLKLLQDIFLRNPTEAKQKGIDIPTLFGNLDEVIDVAGRLLRRLQKVSRDNQLIGECFVDMSDELKEIYGHYCRNHDEVNSIVDKIEPQSAAGQFLSHKIELMKRQTNCFDLPSMLIKPVQRILKYPLLLNELLKCTEDSHADKQWLIQATNLMTDVAAAVNEFKRRKDLVFKYRKQADTSLSGRISKLTVHSMAKKTSRLGMRLTCSFGLKTVAKDEEFDKVLRRFTALEKSLKIFQKDVCDYIKRNEELITTAFNMSEEIAEFYQEKKNQQEVDQFRSTHRTISTKHWDTYKQVIERNVNSPIKLLLQSFRGPTNLIQKRYDKLLDFESSQTKVEKNKDVTKIKMIQDNLTMAKHTYEALNSQLLDDLPKLCNLSIEILHDCIRSFLKSKKNFIGRTAILLIKLMDLPLFLGSQGGSSILETFQVKHTLVMDDLSHLSILPKELQSCTKTDTLKRNSSPRLSFSTGKAQSPNQQAKVTSTYDQNCLYSACQNFDAVDIMDISLKKGDVVGVIKQQDPMGKKLRWFVDNGEAKGFVPAKYLVKFLSPSQNDWTPILKPSFEQRKSQDIYAKPQKTKQQKPQQTVQPIRAVPANALQPARPAPPPSSSLRVVAPSRYPSVSQNAAKPLDKNFSSVTGNLPATTGNFPATAGNSSPTTDKFSSMTGNLSSTVSYFPSSTSNPSSTTGSFSSMTQKSVLNQNLTAAESEHRYEEIGESQAGLQLGKVGTNAPHRTSTIIDEFDPYSTAQPPVSQLYDNVPDNYNSVYSEHRYEDIPDDMNYDQVPSDSQPQTVSEYYYGLYEFSPTGANQLSLQKGQVVLVLHKCDLNKNSEWWFVEDRHGSKGYVPAAYLNPYSKDAA